MFNLMHYASGVKVDLIVRKDSEYRKFDSNGENRLNWRAYRLGSQAERT